MVKDPTGKKRALLPVRVRDVSPLDYSKRERISTWWTGRAPGQAELIDEIRTALQIAKGGRAKPLVAPEFPSDLKHDADPEPRFPNEQTEPIHSAATAVFERFVFAAPVKPRHQDVPASKAPIAVAIEEAEHPLTRDELLPSERRHITR